MLEMTTMALAAFLVTHRAILELESAVRTVGRKKIVRVSRPRTIIAP